MHSKFSLVIVLTHIVSTCLAANFSVLCNPFDYGGTGVSVNIDGTSYPMVSKNKDILYEYYFKGTPKKYYYEITGANKNELQTFGSEREWDPKATSTLYEVYDRRHTTGDKIIKTIPRLYQPLKGYDDFSLLFQEGEIPVINVHMKENDYNELISFTNDEKFKYFVDFDFYTPHAKLRYFNATIKLSGQGSATLDKKPYKFDLVKEDEDKKNKKIFGLKEFKLRSIRYDQSGIRNKLTNDLAVSLGLPVTQSGFCRLYINNKSYGLYEIADLYKKKFLRRFFDIKKTGQDYAYGAFYKGHYKEKIPAYLYSDFAGKPIEQLYETIVPETGNTNVNAEIMNVIDWLNKLPDNASKSEIEKQFDVDMFLKYAIIEYLICHWDGYLGHGNNYFMYVEPNNGKYHFISYDFDSTLGKWCNTMDGSIDEYVTNVLSEENRFYGDEPQRKPLLYSKIINNPEIRPVFDNLTKEIVNNLFNIEALGPRIDYFYEFLKDDLYWDVSCYNIIETKNSEDADVQPVPTIEDINSQFTSLEKTKYLKGYIKTKSENVAMVYNMTEPFKAEGKFGTVGDKLVDNGEGGVSQLNSSSASATNKSTLLLFTLLTLLLTYLF